MSQKILEAQQAFMYAGYQWQESIFNDNCEDNCYIVFSKNTSPVYFERHPEGDFAFGRFSREKAWSMALDWLETIKSLNRTTSL